MTPNFSTVFFADTAIDVSLLRSTSKGKNRSPNPANCANAEIDLEVAATLCPFDRSCFARAKPIPLDAPVMYHTFLPLIVLYFNTKLCRLETCVLSYRNHYLRNSNLAVGGWIILRM